MSADIEISLPIRVVIADDHAIIRQGISALLAPESDIEVIACVENGELACQAAQALAPDVVVMDMLMPIMGGLEATRTIGGSGKISILVLSADTERRHIVEILEAGAMGYIEKGAAFEEIIEGIRTVARKKVFLSTQIQKMILDDFLKRVPEEHAQGYDVLSGRECEVLQLLAQGKCTKEIAYYYNVSIKTVENQRQSIMKKLNFNTLADLTRYAIREGLISC